MKYATRPAAIACVSALLIWQGAVALDQAGLSSSPAPVLSPDLAIGSEQAGVAVAAVRPVRPRWQTPAIDPFAIPLTANDVPRLAIPERAPAAAAVEAPMPVFPYRQFGRMIATDGQTIDYIVYNDAIRLLRAGEVIDGVYRIDQVNDEGLELTYLPTDTPLRARTGRLPTE